MSSLTPKKRAGDAPISQLFLLIAVSFPSWPHRKRGYSNKHLSLSSSFGDRKEQDPLLFVIVKVTESLPDLLGFL